MSKFVVMAGWDDVPHLDNATKEELLKSIPAFQRDARSKGIPQLGSGAIYPVGEDSYKIADFAIPDHWPRSYGMDVGWNWTAAQWYAYDLDGGVKYIYRVYKAGHEQPAIHAEAIKAPGDWIPGVIDPAANISGQFDGSKLFDIYKGLGLNITKAKNSVESGLLNVWQDLSAGKVKVFESCTPFFGEIRLYRRDEKGKVVKKNDHIMDSWRYNHVSGLAVACVKPHETTRVYEKSYLGRGSWMR
jgi:hypothetical protein